jgi:hypothetical protein
MNLVALRILNKKDFIGCAKAYEDVVKLTPKDAAAQYRLGFCYYNQVKPANDLVLEANAKLIAFVKLCNDAAEREHAKLVEFVNACNENGRTCGTDENKAMIAELTAKSEAAACASEENQKQITEFTSKQDVQNKVFEELRDKAVDALARSLAVEPTGPDAAPTRGLLETLYKTKKNAPLTLEQFVAEKKKELGE